MAKRTQKHVKHPAKRTAQKSHLRLIAIGLIAFGMLWITLVIRIAPTKHLQQIPKVVVVSGPSPKQQSQSTKPAPTLPPPSPAPVTHILKPATISEIPHSTKPEPVVTPSPSSSVSSLAPVTTPSTGSDPTGNKSATSSTPPAITTGYTSSNWSGYMATNGVFSAVTAAWVVPSATGIGGVTSADSAWIGIGGVSSGDLIQVGTENTVSPSGHVYTAAFYELLPGSAITIQTMSVSDGDTMNASLQETSSGEWTITIVDATNSESFTLNTSYASSSSSTEWIEEDPSYSSHRQIPFDNFHVVNFSTSTMTMGGTTLGIGSSSAQPVTMLNSSGDPIATPSALSGDGFSVMRN